MHPGRYFVCVCDGTLAADRRRPTQLVYSCKYPQADTRECVATWLDVTARAPAIPSNQIGRPHPAVTAVVPPAATATSVRQPGAPYAYRWSSRAPACGWPCSTECSARGWLR
eukprot:1169136-Prymnesium_polylepis.2